MQTYSPIASPLPHACQPSPSDRLAFTLIELLTVIAIIGILAAIIIPTVGAVRQTAQTASCVSNMRQIAMAMNIYADDNKGLYPPSFNDAPADDKFIWPERLNDYLGLPSRQSGKSYHKNSKVWHCGSAQILDPTALNPNRHYGLNRYFNGQGGEDNWKYRRENVPALSRYILIGEINNNGETVSPPNGPQGVTPVYDGSNTADCRISHKNGTIANYAFCDGHVESIKGGADNLPASPVAATNRWRWWNR